MRKRVVMPPASHGGGLPPNSVNSVELDPGETVRWIWTHTPAGSYVSGYKIVRAPKTKKAK